MGSGPKAGNSGQSTEPVLERAQGGDVELDGPGHEDEDPLAGPTPERVQDVGEAVGSVSRARRR